MDPTVDATVHATVAHATVDVTVAQVMAVLRNIHEPRGITVPDPIQVINAEPGVRLHSCGRTLTGGRCTSSLRQRPCLFSPLDAGSACPGSVLLLHQLAPYPTHCIAAPLTFLLYLPAAGPVHALEE